MIATYCTSYAQPHSPPRRSRRCLCRASRPTAHGADRARLRRATRGAGPQRQRQASRQAARSAAVPAIRRPASGHESARYGRRRRLLTELMARAVAPNGMVYGAKPGRRQRQDESRFRGAAGDAGDERRRRRRRGRSTIRRRAGVQDLDLITFLFFYHDTTYMDVDRGAMNKAMFAALKPGGTLVIADHAALPGQGTTVGKTLHRIEEATLNARKSKPPVSSSSPKAISGAMPPTRKTIRATRTMCRSTISC